MLPGEAWWDQGWIAIELSVAFLFLTLDSPLCSLQWAFGGSGGEQLFQPTSDECDLQFYMVIEGGVPVNSWCWVCLVLLPFSLSSTNV